MSDHEPSRGGRGRAAKPAGQSAGKTAGRTAGSEPPATPDVGKTPEQVEKIETIAHELNNLLDGSMRLIGIAKRTLDAAQREPDGGKTDPSKLDQSKLDAARQQLGTASKALERMSGLVHTAMQGVPSPIAAASRGPGGLEGTSLRDALRHAAELVAPEAAEHRAGISLEGEESLGDVPAGALYSVFVNALRNAVESIAVGGGIGRITIRAEVGEVPRLGRAVTIEVIDDGVGLPDDLTPRDLFTPGVSTKQGGFGIGLSLSKDIVTELGGTIEILPRTDREGGRRPGALLRVSVPERRLRVVNAA